MSLAFGRLIRGSLRLLGSAAVLGVVGLAGGWAYAQTAAGASAHSDERTVQHARLVQAQSIASAHWSASCWLYTWSQVNFGFSVDAGKPLVVTGLRPNSPLVAAGVKAGDRPIRSGELVIDAMGLEGLKQLSEAAQAHRAAIERGVVPQPLVFRSPSGAEVAVTGAVAPNCDTRYVVLPRSDRAAERILGGGLTIDAGRLSLLSDDELLAFVLWNELFTQVRPESSGTGMSLLARSARFPYSEATLAKVDWLVLKALHAQKLGAAPYTRMLKKVNAFDQAAGLSLLVDKRFVSNDSGGSPRWNAETEQRLLAWEKKLIAGDLASVEASMKWSNPMLMGPAVSNRTQRLQSYQALARVLLPILGESSADAAKQYLGDPNAAAPSHAMSPGLQSSIPLGFQMLVAHHESKRVLFFSKTAASSTIVSTLCGTPSSQQCSVLAVGKLAVAEANEVWLAELKQTGPYSFEQSE